MNIMDKVDSFLIKAGDKFNTLVGKKVVVNCLYLGMDKISLMEQWMVMGKIDYSSDVCSQRLEKVDHAAEISALQEQIKKLESDYRTVSTCWTVDKQKTVWVDSVTVYIFKVVKSVRVVVEKFLLPATGAR